MPVLFFDHQCCVLAHLLSSSQSDVRICLPVPMFHCFGAVLAGITMAVHGASLVFPSAEYKLKVLLDTLQDER